VTTPILIDCDPGHDDAIALLLALASPEVELLGVTSVAGNQTLDKTTANALRVLEFAGRGDVPVAAGADRPLVREQFVAAYVHGETGLDGPDLPPPQGKPVDQHAVEFLADTIRNSDRPVTLIPVGPVLIWLPATIWLFTTGETGWAIFLIVWSIMVFGVIEALLRTFLVSRGSDLPMIMILLGLFVFKMPYDEFAGAFGKTIESLSKASLEALQRYSWPGNVRELRNVIERAVIIANSPTLVVELPQPTAATRRKSLKFVDVETEHIRSVLESTGGRIRGSGGAAELLGLKPTTLESRMTRLGISRSGPTAPHARATTGGPRTFAVG